MIRLVSMASAIAFIALTTVVSGQNRHIDFQWAPETYFTVVGLPDDWQKTMVTEKLVLK